MTRVGHREGQLYVEQYLALLPSRAERQAFQLSVVAKINRGCQLGILRGDEGAMLKAFNRIRNCFSHEPRAYLSEEAMQELWATLSSRIKARIAGIERLGPEDFDVPLNCLKCCIVAICATFEEDLGDTMTNSPGAMTPL
jgi:hypothetical protein